MNRVKECSRRTLFWIILIFGFLCVLVDIGFLYLLNVGTIRMVSLSQPLADSAQLREFIHQLASWIDLLRLYFIPASGVVFAFFGLFLWLMLRFSISRALAGAAEAPSLEKTQHTPKKPAGETAEEKAARRRHEKRLFLHLLSALQREGRLLDFLAEDLDDYEDDQVGAAVRTIHDNCRKGLSKYLKTEAVVSAEEETEITVPADFDPAAIRLAGNVTGDPPFTGVVRHRGWRAAGVEMPSLSSVTDPDIIAPAEVEVK